MPKTWGFRAKKMEFADDEAAAAAPPSQPPPSQPPPQPPLAAAASLVRSTSASWVYGLASTADPSLAGLGVVAFNQTDLERQVKQELDADDAKRAAVSKLSKLTRDHRRTLDSITRVRMLSSLS